MRGTLVCGVVDREDGRGALDVAVEVSERLGLRLVLAHAGGGFDPIAADGQDAESVSTQADREGGERLLARLVAEYGLADRAERRVRTGDAATVIGQIAAEEAADLIVVGSQARGRLRRGFQSRLAERLGSETPVPVLIALPADRRTGTMAT